MNFAGVAIFDKIQHPQEHENRLYINMTDDHKVFVVLLTELL